MGLQSPAIPASGARESLLNLLYRWSNGRVTLDCMRRKALDDPGTSVLSAGEGRNVP